MLSNSPVHFKPVKYVIMDLDGTLIDSEIIMKHVHEKQLGKYGIDLTEELRLKSMGRIPKDMYEILMKETDLDISLEEYVEVRDILHEKYMKNVQLMPGAKTLINWLYERSIPIAVATSSNRKEVEIKTKNHKDFFDKFHHITTRDDIKRGKPYPDIFLECASQFVLLPKPKEILVFEDSLAGVEAARSAGMQVVLVTDSPLTEEQKQRATKAISCLSEFDPREFKISAWV